MQVIYLITKQFFFFFFKEILLKSFCQLVRPICRLILLYRSICQIYIQWTLIIPVSLIVYLFSYYLSSDVCCQEYVGCLSSVADLNWLISLIDFINYIAFFKNFGWISIFSQFIFPKAAFLLFSSYVLFYSLIYVWHSVNI